MPVKKFLVKLCRTLAAGMHQIYQNSRFYMIRLTFYDHYKSLQTLLFYSKQKVWIFPEILRSIFLVVPPGVFFFRILVDGDFGE